MFRRAFLLVALSFLFPVAAMAAPDMSISANDIRFSTSTLVAGEDVRIYATVKNIGDEDISAYVLFWQGTTHIGKSQVVSTKSGGENDEVWVDFTVPDSSFNIRAEVKGADPADANPANDVALTPLFTPVQDADGDGVEDEDDNCVDDANSSQTDTDNDGEGDACDTDDDNDGLTDDEEDELGSDPEDRDTDNDGVWDGEDFDPTNPEITEEPVGEVAAENDEEPDPSESNDALESEEDQEDEDAEEDEATDDEEDNEEEEDEDAVASAQADEATPQALMAAFVYSLDRWKEYNFRSLVEPADGVTLVWDFDDGAASSQQEVSHRFPSVGKYNVSLTVRDGSGNSDTYTREVQVSFFHMGNPMILVTIGVLGFVILLGLILIIKKPRRRNTDTSPVLNKMKSSRPAQKPVMVSTPPGRAPVTSTTPKPPAPPKKRPGKTLQKTTVTAASVLQRAVEPVKKVVDTGKAAVKTVTPSAATKIDKTTPKKAVKKTPATLVKKPAAKKAPAKKKTVKKKAAPKKKTAVKKKAAPKKKTVAKKKTTAKKSSTKKKTPAKKSAKKTKKTS